MRRNSSIRYDRVHAVTLDIQNDRAPAVISSTWNNQKLVATRGTRHNRVPVVSTHITADPCIVQKIVKIQK